MQQIFSDKALKTFRDTEEWIARVDFIPQPCAMVFPSDARLMDTLILFFDLYFGATFVNKKTKEGFFTARLQGTHANLGDVTTTLFVPKDKSKCGIDVRASNTMEIEDFANLLRRAKAFIEKTLENDDAELSQEDLFDVPVTRDVWDMVCEDTNPECEEEVCKLLKLICTQKDAILCAQALAANAFIEKSLQSNKAYSYMADCCALLGKRGAAVLLLPQLLPSMVLAMHALKLGSIPNEEALHRAIVLTSRFYDLVSSESGVFEQSADVCATIQGCLASCSETVRCTEPKEYLSAALCALQSAC